MRFRARPAAARIEINMTPMIDVVFQLLAFFIVSFKVVLPEGDLAVKMPRDATDGAMVVNHDLPLQVRLRADASGELAAVEVSGEALAGPQALRRHVEEILAVSPDRAETLGVDLVCDTGLRYRHVMAAMTAVSGKREAGRVLPLASNVRLVKAER